MPPVDEPLAVDPTAAAFLAELTAVGYAALVILSAHFVEDEPAEIQLWPEHFDLATSFAEVNYGLSPGDAVHPWPYVYVGPWSPPEQGGFWNEPFGASLSFEAMPTVDQVLTFFGEGHALGVTARPVGETATPVTDYSDLKALFINCTLKRSPEVSNTQGLADKAIAILEANGVETETIRALDHDIATGRLAGHDRARLGQGRLAARSSTR